MSNSDEEFLQRLRATFIVEAEEHVQAMSAGLLELERTPAAEVRPEAIEAVFRRAHSLKGAARATSFVEVERICQELETVFAEWKRQRIAPSPEHFDTLHRAVDVIGKLLPTTGGKRSREDEESISATLRDLGRLLAGELPSPRERLAPPPAAVAPAVVAAPPAPAVAVTEPDIPAQPARPLAETIRVAAAKLDRLLLHAEEMLPVKQNTAQRSAELRELEPLFEQWSLRWSRIQPQWREFVGAPSAAGSALAEFIQWNCDHVELLGTKVRGLAKSAARDREDAAKRVDDLLSESKHLVMLPFSTLSDLFPKLVRDLGRDMHKEVKLVVRGGEVELDKRILEQIKDPLVHLLRNGVDHGIEARELRVQQGKPAQATITLAVAPVDGNKVEITVSDDGAGIDLERVKQAALKRGIIPPEQLGSLDDQKALELVFRSDVSTSPIITEISGRGLGLAIVRERAEKLGGRVFVESQPPHGTTFRIAVPTTLATFRGILVNVAGRIFVVPTAHVARAARVNASDIRTVENRETISLDGRAVSLARLDQVLELPRHDHPAATDFISVLLLGSGDERIAFAVDEVLHDEEVLVKRLPRPLSRVRNVAGATVVASGRLAVVLNIGDVLKSARSTAGATRAAPAPGTPRTARPKSILMAEDSITSRMLLKGILESAGYQVTTAVDGVEAWMKLRTEEFDLIVSDVEMPRMNGFDLTAHIRADKKLADKPVVLVTALASQQDRERGIDVGASAYIVKSSFDQSNLLDVIRRLA